MSTPMAAQLADLIAALPAITSPIDRAAYVKRLQHVASAVLAAELTAAVCDAMRTRGWRDASIQLDMSRQAIARHVDANAERQSVARSALDTTRSRAAMSTSDGTPTDE